MNNQFDELTKSLAQSLTRRQAFKKFGVGLAGMALAAFGLANRAEAGKVKTCATDADCTTGGVCCNGSCWDRPSWCDPTNSCCCYCTGNGKNRRYGETALTPCDPGFSTCSQACESIFSC